MPGCRSATAALLALLAACRAASPDPEALAAAALPELQLDAAATAAAAEAADRAVAALDARRLELAEELARDVLARAPRQPRARAVLGLCLLRRAQTVTPADLHLQNTADGETLRASRLAPSDLVVGRLRAQFLAAVEHLAAAAATGEAVLAQNQPDAGDDYVALLACCAEWRYELGEERLARRHLEPLTELRPDNATAWFRLGYCWLREADAVGGARAAVRAFARCAELAPGDEDVLLAAGKARLRAAGLGDAAALPAAAETFAAAQQQFPQSAEAAFCHGVVLQRLQQKDAAAAAFEQALQRDPEHLGALLDLAALRLAEPATAAAGRALLRRALAAGSTGRQPLSPRERQQIEAALALPPSR